MIICDLCNRECLDDRRVTIHYDYACKAYQSKEVHMCGRCRSELEKERLQAEVEFYQRKVAHKVDENAVVNAERYFTPEEVCNMTREEVKENYTAIMNSMKQWN